MMQFEILGDISQIETIARGSGIRRGRWRKCKGIARVRPTDGIVHLAGIVCLREHRLILLLD